MSKQLSIISTTALVAVALLGSAVLLPALQRTTLERSAERAAVQSSNTGRPVSNPIHVAERPATSTMVDDAGPTASVPSEIIDFTTVYTRGDDGSDGRISATLGGTGPRPIGTDDDWIE